jgi:tetratricopeptide (TPR) repeat protein
LGLVYLDSGQYDKAIQACRELLCINSEDPKAWYNLGIAHGWAEAAGDSGLPTRDASSSASYLE